ncbi:hypothetical protein M405DRAFT_822747 [Rhizopogon salebrosus TDB-379]|nr:hypothetical protein M405DRAFT_822747 [Rhizopogon salebrosus TDB-379]
MIFPHLASISHVPLLSSAPLLLVHARFLYGQKLTEETKIQSATQIDDLRKRLHDETRSLKDIDKWRQGLRCLPGLHDKLI